MRVSALAGGPGHETPAQKVQVQMGDRVVCVWARVEHQAIAAFGDAFLTGHVARGTYHGAHERVVLGLECLGVGDVRVRHDQLKGHAGGSSLWVEFPMDSGQRCWLIGGRSGKKPAPL